MHSRGKLFDIHRFLKEILHIRLRFEFFHIRVRQSLGRHDKNGNAGRAVLLKFLEDRDPVFAGKHQIQNDQVNDGSLFGHDLNDFFPGRKPHGVEPFADQGQLKEIQDRDVIVDD